jgi:predicted Zn-dependent protease
MKISKKISIPVFTFLLTFIITTTSYAATLGYLNYWDTDGSVIGRWGSTTPSIYNYPVDGSMQGTLPSYVTHARSEWNNAGIPNNSTSTESNAHIKVYGGTYTNLKAIEPSLSSSDTGLCVSTRTNEGEWLALGTYKTGYKQTAAKVYIVYITGKTANGYKKTTTHEIGHSLGWSGHTNNSADIMYHTASEVTSLSAVDKRHLKQVY